MQQVKELTPERIAELREGLGWSKAELSRRAGMGAPEVGKIENRRIVAYPGQLAKIRAAFVKAGALDDDGEQ